MADTAALVGTLRGTIAMLREDRSTGESAIRVIYGTTHPAMALDICSRPAARGFATMRSGRARAVKPSLKRLLPRALTASVPRRLGAIADLPPAVAAITGNSAARASDI